MKKKVIDVQKAKLYQIGGGSNFDSDSDSEKKFPANPTPTPTPKISGLLTPAPTPTPTESESKSGFGVPRWSLVLFLLITIIIVYRWFYLPIDIVVDNLIIDFYEDFVRTRSVHFFNEFSLWFPLFFLWSESMVDKSKEEDLRNNIEILFTKASNLSMKNKDQKTVQFEASVYPHTGVWRIWHWACDYCRSNKQNYER
jgi:hypothetical protein